MEIPSKGVRTRDSWSHYIRSASQELRSCEYLFAKLLLLGFMLTLSACSHAKNQPEQPLQVSSKEWWKHRVEEFCKGPTFKSEPDTSHPPLLNLAWPNSPQNWTVTSPLISKIKSGMIQLSLDGEWLIRMESRDTDHAPVSLDVYFVGQKNASTLSSDQLAYFILALVDRRMQTALESSQLESDKSGGPDRASEVATSVPSGRQKARKERISACGKNGFLYNWANTIQDEPSEDTLTSGSSLNKAIATFPDGANGTLYLEAMANDAAVFVLVGLEPVGCTRSSAQELRELLKTADFMDEKEGEMSHGI